MNRNTLTAELGKLGIDVRDGKVRRADVKAVIESIGATNAITADDDWSESDSLAAINAKLMQLQYYRPYKPARDDGIAEKLGVVDIEPKSLGMMAPMFRSIAMTVSAGVKGDHGVIILGYSYKLRGGGSNGHTVRYECYKGVWRDPS